MGNQNVTKHLTSAVLCKKITV